MRSRVHRGFGHGLRPGSDQDLNCTSCKREREAGQWPVIAGEGKEEPGMALAGSDDIAGWIAKVGEAQVLIDHRLLDQAQDALEEALAEMRPYT